MIDKINNWSVLLTLFLISSIVLFGCRKQTEYTPDIVLTNVSELSGLASSAVRVDFKVQNPGACNEGKMGICYAKHSLPVLNEDDLQVWEALKTEGSYRIIVEQLEQGATYYFRAFGVNEMGLQYSNKEIAYTVPYVNGGGGSTGGGGTGGGGSTTPTCTPTTNTMTDGTGPELTMTNYYASTPFNNYSEYWFRASDGTSLKLRINFLTPVVGTYTTANVASVGNANNTIKIWKQEQVANYYTNTGQTAYIEQDPSGQLAVVFCDIEFTSTTKTSLLSARVLLP
ncbi:MAG: Unknown protein [uncultured Aureispira sp.]|uniref:Fibronectin type-III domain-containing protein n=1 Tax=uncultured Aureispira sp. TaxID=1331704 RepID=A0A6S6UGM5_9BACT|nr:MAG: Unknown protein [uncultured Aureispira sp.]